ncbi:MAG TPA: hypothetical protein VGQ53_19220 [Chitinophagaceae bacterium]|jgi:hypothetical protein|nr:hypothetical protein [Chitinophagaceae bacterium]
MEQNVERVGDLYGKYQNLLILHAITRPSAEAILPDGVRFSDQVKCALEKISKVKLDAFSFTFSINDRKNMYGPIGLIIKDAEIIRGYCTDGGYTVAYVESGYPLSPSEDFVKVIFEHRENHNNFLLRNVEVCGIYVGGIPFGYMWKEIKEAQIQFDLKVYFLDTNGIRLTAWNDDTICFEVLADEIVDREVVLMLE